MICLPEVADISYFTNESENVGRSSNDHNNKIRENIICCMAHIDDTYFNDAKYGEDWIHLKKEFNEKMKLMCPTYHSYKIQHKAGRKFNYDYLITFLDDSNKTIVEKKLEFKFNASCIDETPQFVSPMNPSQYLSESFENFYYDNYLVGLLASNGVFVPDKEIYLKTIHNNKPKCMEKAQQLYYQGCKQSSKFNGTPEAIQFYEKCNEASRNCISTFIKNTELNIEKLTQYLIDSQDNKNYLLYKNGEFNIQTANNDDYIIVSCSKNPEKSRYEAVTKTNKKINILLRWKNGNGIAYPAFQIS